MKPNNALIKSVSQELSQLKFERYWEGFWSASELLLSAFSSSPTRAYRIWMNLFKRLPGIRDYSIQQLQIHLHTLMPILLPNCSNSTVNTASLGRGSRSWLIFWVESRVTLSIAHLIPRAINYHQINWADFSRRQPVHFARDSISTVVERSHETESCSSRFSQVPHDLNSISKSTLWERKEKFIKIVECVEFRGFRAIQDFNLNI